MHIWTRLKLIVPADHTANFETSNSIETKCMLLPSRLLSNFHASLEHVISCAPTKPACRESRDNKADRVEKSSKKKLLYVKIKKKGGKPKPLKFSILQAENGSFSNRGLLRTVGSRESGVGTWTIRSARKLPQ
jgi:hypothetical protein